jgi:hypothetical protein
MAKEKLTGVEQRNSKKPRIPVRIFCGDPVTFSFFAGFFRQDSLRRALSAGQDHVGNLAGTRLMEDASQLVKGCATGHYVIHNQHMFALDLSAVSYTEGIRDVPKAFC